MDGHFRTLPENSNEIRFVVVSDSHRFETATKVSDVIAQFDPDFILHTGDMVEGTGSQKDQFPYWFQNVGSFSAQCAGYLQQRQPRLRCLL